MTSVVLEEVAGDGFSILRIPGFAPAQRHAFVVRERGQGPLFRPGPVPREALVRVAGLEGAVLHLPRQVHGAAVIELPAERDRSRSAPPTPSATLPDRSAPGRGAVASGSELPSSPPSPEADALVTRTPGHAVGVATADCLPILLALPRGGCAAVHAGWRGLLAGVIEASLRELSGTARTSGALRSEPPAGAEGPITAAIGPAIGPCCFEVGSEVAEQFQARFPGSGGIVRPAQTGRKSYIDLPAAASLVLESEGVAPGAIARTGLCTRCGNRPFESFRRDGSSAGRMIALIGPRL